MDIALVEALLSADPRAVGARIRTARVAAGLTQPQLGGADASVAYVSRIEKGERRPGPELLEVFAGRLGVGLEQLVLGERADRPHAVELELDLAELELTGGKPELALARLEPLLSSSDVALVPSGVARTRFLYAAALDAVGDARAATAYDEVIATDDLGSFAIEACTALSRLQREAGEFDVSIASAERGLQIAADNNLAGSEETIRLSVTLAAALYERGDVERSADVCRQAVDAAESLASPRARAAAYWNTSIIEAESGNTARALHLAKKALRLLESTDGVRDLARLRTQLGTILLRAGQPDLAEAREQLDQARQELSWSHASPADRSRNDLVTARLHYLDGDYDTARALGEQALHQSENLPLLRSSALALLGRVSAANGDKRAARRHFRQAIDTLAGTGNGREAARLWFEIGNLADESGCTEDARDAYRHAAAASGLAAPH